MMTTHYSSACSCLLTHSTLGYTEPLNKVKCTDGGVKKKITKVQEYHRCSTIVQRRQVPEFVPKLELRSHKKCLSLCGKTERREDQKKVGLPWVQSSRNYSLTWKRRQLIHPGKLSVLHKFLC